MLRSQGYDVTHAMNITDVGHFRYSSELNEAIDPILQEAKELGVSALEISQKYTKIFLSDAKKVNILTPDIMPKATEHIKDMIDLIEILIEKGYAYITDGNVYFNVAKFKDYGKLSGNTLDKMGNLLEAVRVSLETDKKDSADFALWKKAEKGRVMKWSSPWGDGFPGWHIECSAMSATVLQALSIDIHAGGEDLIFPHHEDEIAQSEAATGLPFVKYWVHSNYLLVNNEKMSRSKRNVYTISDIQNKKISPLAFRYLCLLTHYRARMNFTWEALAGAQEALDRIYNIAAILGEPKIGCAEYEGNFFNVVSNDLNIPKAISILWEMLHSSYPESAKAESLYKMDEILGLKIKEKGEELKNVPSEILAMIEDRDKLRRAKKFNASDKIRRDIEKKGYVVEDEEKGTRILRKI